MSTGGQVVGGVVGAVVGFIGSGFNPTGALYGAQIGLMAGGYLDPIGEPLRFLGELPARSMTLVAEALVGTVSEITLVAPVLVLFILPQLSSAWDPMGWLMRYAVGPAFNVVMRAAGYGL